MIITLDTNFLISSTQFKSSLANKLLIKFIENEFQLFTSNKILNEFFSFLERDFKYSLEDLIYVKKIILSFLIIVAQKIKLKIIKNDPADNSILECAIASNSDYIITFDKDLLSLKEFSFVKIISPETALKILFSPFN